MRKMTTAWLLCLLALASAQVRAEDDTTIADVRCVVVGLRLSNDADARQRSAGLMTTLYYMGRLDGRVPALDLEAALLKEINTMTASDYVSEGMRCGAALSARGEQVTQIGKDLSEREREQDKAHGSQK